MNNLDIDKINIDKLNIDKLNIYELNINELNIFLNKLSIKQKELDAQQTIITRIKKKIKQERCIKCKKEFKEHNWIKEKENCMYGETYIYCSRCGKDHYSSAIYDI